MTRRLAFSAGARVWLLLASLVALGLVAGCGDSRTVRMLGPGDSLPELDLPALDGEPIELEDLRGDRPVVLNFWATWCAPCVHEIPTLRELHRSGAVEVISVSVDDGGAEVVRPFVAEHGIEYPVLLGDVGYLQSLGAVAIPFTLVADGDLRIRRVHRNLVTLRTLEKDLDAARRPLPPARVAPAGRATAGPA